MADNASTLPPDGDDGTQRWWGLVTRWWNLPPSNTNVIEIPTRDWTMTTDEALNLAQQLIAAALAKPNEADDA